MKSRQSRLLLNVMSKPDEITSYSLAEWALLLRQCRSTGLLSRLRVILEASGKCLSVPEQPQAHLDAGRQVADSHKIAVHHEILRINVALANLGLPLVLLKGAAYSALDLDVANGRIFSDIDILVPKDSLSKVENEMMLNGWVSTHVDDYDERYYRDWMHELPPMKHGKRQTVIDIHHAILPETARLSPDPKKLLVDIVPVDGQENVFVLAPVDMVLHSATHLFHDGELEHGLRDLVDLDGLLRHFSKDEDFWGQLIERAVEMDLSRPLYYALRYTQQMLHTPVPDVANKASEAIGKPPAYLAGLMDALFDRALMPDHPSCDDAFTPLARWVLYIRSHYLRMPFHLLIPHLVRKAIKKRFGSSSAEVLKPEEN